MGVQRIQFGVVAAALWADAGKVDLRSTAVASRAAGSSGVQFDAVSASLDLTDLSASGRREFRSILLGQGQQIVGLRADAGPRGFGVGADVDRILSRLDRMLETAAGLQSPLVCLDLGPLPAPAAADKPRPKITAEHAGLIFLPPASSEPAPYSAPAPPPDTAFMSLVDSALSDLGRRADRYKVVVAMRSDLASLAALERALAAAGCPWFGVDLDPVALLRDEWAADEAFSRLGPLIRHVRGRDALAGADKRTRPAAIGRGSTHWRQFLALLDEAGYSRWLTLDPIELTDRHAAAVAGLEFLRKL